MRAARSPLAALVAAIALSFAGPAAAEEATTPTATTTTLAPPASPQDDPIGSTPTATTEPPPATAPHQDSPGFFDIGGRITFGMALPSCGTRPGRGCCNSAPATNR